jgi:hypothetical protein
MGPVELPAGKQSLLFKNRELGTQRRVSVTVPSGVESPIKVRVDMLE